MAAVTTLFLLFAFMQTADNGVSLTQLGSFDSAAACESAATTINAAIKAGTPVGRIGCIPATALNALRPR
jgi:hypothetical protein